MTIRPSLVRAVTLAAVSFLLLGGSARPAAALELTAFVSDARPALWGTGVGGTLSSTWFKVACFEAELARQPGVPVDSSMTTFSASALLAPAIGPVTPFGGFGVGIYRQSRGDARENGTLKTFILGAKVKVGGLVVIRAEYRGISLAGTPLLDMDKRLSAGIGISF
jgi:hypothetical protein